MSAPDSSAEERAADAGGLKAYVQAMYLLHAVSILIGALSSAFILTAFVFGLPSLVAVVMNYARRREAAGTWLEDHFRWQLRSFWFAALWLAASTLAFGPLLLIGIGVPLLLLAYAATGLWAAYRVMRGWLALREGRGPGS